MLTSLPGSVYFPPPKPFNNLSHFCCTVFSPPEPNCPERRQAGGKTQRHVAIAFSIAAGRDTAGSEKNQQATGSKQTPHEPCCIN